MIEHAHWNAVKTLLDDAMQLAPADRHQILDEIVDARVRAEVESLLIGLDDDAFLQPPDRETLERAIEAYGTASPGARVGRYELIELIAQGGMGVVYRAARADDVYEQIVAIKVMRPHLITDDMVDRFHRERQVLARLEHPSITRLLDGGTTADGLPYLVMEYVDGEPIDAACRHQATSARDRLSLFVEVCRAVQFAHQNLVVHGDIKPANVLVTGEGAVRLIDFGVAGLVGLDHSNADDVRPATPGYAAPELASGSQITTAADIFALGVMLRDLMGEPESGDRQLADIDFVIARATAVEPCDRYVSVAELADEVEHVLTSRPIRARRATLPYVACRFARRHRSRVIAGAVVVVLWACALAGMTFGFLDAREARDTAESQRNAAIHAMADGDRAMAFFEDLLATTNPYLHGRSPTVLEVLDDAERRIDGDLRDRPRVEARVRLAVGRLYTQLMMWPEATPHLARALMLLDDDADADELVVAETLSLLGRALTHERRPAAVGIQERGLEIRRRRLGPQSPLIAESLGNLAFATWASAPRHANWPRAERLYRESIAMHQASGTGETDDAARVMMSLAFMYAHCERYDDAEPLYQQALGIYDQLPFTDDRYESATLGCYATMLSRTGRLTEAASLIERQIATAPRDITSTALVNQSWHLTWLYVVLDDFDRAAGAMANAIRIESPALAAQPDRAAVVSSCIERLGSDASSRDTVVDAMRDWIAIALTTHRTEPDRLAIMLRVVGKTLAESGFEPEARRVLDRGMAILRERLPATHEQLNRTRAVRDGI